MDKESLYRQLIEDVKDTYKNPIIISDKLPVLKWCGNCEEINLWTYWQGRGNLDARIMLVGQDWGCAFDKNSKETSDILTKMILDNPDSFFPDYANPTDRNLTYLFYTIGKDITEKCDDLFFTNFVLGYREEGTSGKFQQRWIYHDAVYFNRLVNIIEPEIVICLGKAAFEGVLFSFSGKMKHIDSFNRFIESDSNPQKMYLSSGKPTHIFAVSHCGKMGTMNRNRSVKIKNQNLSSNNIDLQIKDWSKIQKYL